MSSSFGDGSFPVEDYCQHRPRYPHQLYDVILDYHKTPIDGQPSPQETKLALDLGCGPGIATVDLVPYFDKVIGVDESESMIQAARLKSPQLEFHVGGANCLPMIESETVDLIAVACAAHWFPQDWWEEARRILKPGGTIAMWVYSAELILEPSHPKSKQLGQQIAALTDLIGHHTTGNEYAASMYDTLPLPTLDSLFTPAKRISWNRESNDEQLFMSSQVNIEGLRRRIHTWSRVYRWRASNPDARDTKDDPLEKILENIKSSAGWDDSTRFAVGHPLSLVLIKKKA